MRLLEGSNVRTLVGSVFKIYAVFEAPEEYTLEFKGKPGFCAITSETQYG